MLKDRPGLLRPARGEGSAVDIISPNRKRRVPLRQRGSQFATDLSGSTFLCHASTKNLSALHEDRSDGDMYVN